MSTVSAAVLLKRPDETDDAANGFRRLNFQVTTISPGVLLLTAGTAIFEKAFGTQLKVGEKGVVRLSPQGESRSLATDALASPLREMVSKADFESPPDFGPGNF
jgi:hypothetical protein